MLTKLNNASLHLEYLVTPDFIVPGQSQKEKYHFQALVSVLWDIKTTLKKMKLDNLFFRVGGGGSIRLWSNTDAKYIEQNSKESTMETITI